MIDPFEELIHELGKFLNLSLHVDHNRACTLQIRDDLKVQLQLDAAQENFLMASFAIEVPPGKFREHVLREALKTNALPDPRSAILSYLSQNNHLVLHQSFPLFILNGERLAAYFGAFLEEVENWKKAIHHGEPSPMPIAPIQSNAKPFGIRT